MTYFPLAIQKVPTLSHNSMSTKNRELVLEEQKAWSILVGTSVSNTEFKDVIGIYFITLHHRAKGGPGVQKHNDK